MFTEFYSFEKLSSALTDNVKAPMELVDSIVGVIRPSFYATLHSLAKAQKQVYANDLASRQSEAKKIKYLQAFNKLIMNTDKYKKLIKPSQHFFVDVDPSVLETWMLELIAQYETDKPLCRELVNQPNTEIVKYLLQGNGALTVKVVSTVLENQIDCFYFQEGVLTICLGNCINNCLRDKFDLLPVLDNPEEEILNQISTHIDQALSDFLKKKLSEHFLEKDADSYKNTVEKVVNCLIATKSQYCDANLVRSCFVQCKAFENVLPDQKDAFKGQLFAALMKEPQLIEWLLPPDQLLAVINEF